MKKNLFSTEYDLIIPLYLPETAKNLFHAVSRHSGESRNPVLLWITNTLDPGFHRGDEYSVIFSHLLFRKEGFISPPFGIFFLS
jgi:hypothetical protein